MHGGARLEPAAMGRRRDLGGYDWATSVKVLRHYAIDSESQVQALLLLLRAPAHEEPGQHVEPVCTPHLCGSVDLPLPADCAPGIPLVAPGPICLERAQRVAPGKTPANFDGGAR